MALHNLRGQMARHTDYVTSRVWTAWLLKAPPESFFIFHLSPFPLVGSISCLSTTSLAPFSSF